MRLALHQLLYINGQVDNQNSNKAAHSFGMQSIASGKSGITIAQNDWIELIVICTFGKNTDYQFQYYIPREFVTYSGTKKYLQGSADANDTHSVVIEVSATVVKLISWKFRGSEVTENCPMSIYFR